jgi:hypothetical protein
VQSKLKALPIVMLRMSGLVRPARRSAQSTAPPGLRIRSAARSTASCTWVLRGSPKLGCSVYSSTFPAVQSAARVSALLYSVSTAAFGSLHRLIIILLSHHFGVGLQQSSRVRSTVAQTMGFSGWALRTATAALASTAVRSSLA